MHGWLRLGTIKQLDVAKLFVGDAHDAHFAKRRQNGLHPLAVNLCILHARAMAHIDGELKHGKTITKQTFAE